MQSCPTLTVQTPWTVVHQAPLPMGMLQARILEWVAMLSSRVSSEPSIEPGSPALQVDSLPSEPPDLKTTKRIDDSIVNVSDM